MLDGRPPKFEIDVKRFEKIENVDADGSLGVEITNATANREGGEIVVKCNICGIKTTTEIPPFVTVPKLVLKCPRCDWQ
jgi:transcription elongation factor Elf1